MDLDQQTPDEHTWFATWSLLFEKRTWQQIRDEATAAATSTNVADRALANLPPVTVLEALAANAQLVDMLFARRWLAIESAREEGAGMGGDWIGSRHEQAGCVGGVQARYRGAREVRRRTPRCCPGSRGSLTSQFAGCT